VAIAEVRGQIAEVKTRNIAEVRGQIAEVKSNAKALYLCNLTSNL